MIKATPNNRNMFNMTKSVSVPTFRCKPLRLVKHSYKNRVVPSPRCSKKTTPSLATKTQDDILKYLSILSIDDDQLDDNSVTFAIDTATVDKERRRTHYPIEVDPLNEMMMLILEQEH